MDNNQNDLFGIPTSSNDQKESTNTTPVVESAVPAAPVDEPVQSAAETPVVEPAAPVAETPAQPEVTVSSSETVSGSYEAPVAAQPAVQPATPVAEATSESVTPVESVPVTPEVTSAPQTFTVEQAVETPVVENPVQQEVSTQPQQPKKKGHGGIIALVLCLVIIIAVAVVFGDKISSTISDLFNGSNNKPSSEVQPANDNKNNTDNNVIDNNTSNDTTTSVDTDSDNVTPVDSSSDDVTTNPSATTDKTVTCTAKGANYDLTQVIVVDDTTKKVSNMSFKGTMSKNASTSFSYSTGEEVTEESKEAAMGMYIGLITGMFQEVSTDTGVTANMNTNVEPATFDYKAIRSDNMSSKLTQLFENYDGKTSDDFVTEYQQNYGMTCTVK